MGVRRFFPIEGKTFQKGGTKTYYFPKKPSKTDTIFTQKILKTNYFLPAKGGKDLPPLDTHEQ
jgi:hypothetical protein